MKFHNPIFLSSYNDRGGDKYGGDRGGDRYGDRGGDRYGDNISMQYIVKIPLQHYLLAYFVDFLF